MQVKKLTWSSHHCLSCGVLRDAIHVLPYGSCPVVSLSLCLSDAHVRGEIKSFMKVCKQSNQVIHEETEEKKRKDNTFWRQFDEKPGIAPGCPRNNS